MTPEARRAAGFRAKAALEDGALKEAFEEAERAIHFEWARAVWPRTRERLHAELRALERVKRQLVLMAGNAPRD